MRAPFTYTVNCLGGRVRVYQSVAAFDGYVAAIREQGYVVTFSTPFVCQIEAKK